MKKGLIAFAIYCACVFIVAAVDLWLFQIIPVGVEVSSVLVLVTHLPAWLYLWFSKADEDSALLALTFELLARFLLGFMTVSLYNVVLWLFMISWLGARKRRKKHRCDLKKDGEPCEFCAFKIAQEDVKKHAEKWEEDANA